MKVGNDIKVLLTKYNKHVKVDDIGGELILYDNSALIALTDSTSDYLLRDHVFSGIGVSGFTDEVIVRLDNFYEEEQKYMLHKGFIYVKKTLTMDSTDPIALVRFLPKGKFWAGEYFYAHFLEIK